MSLARSRVEGVLGYFTADQAVRAGITTAAWSFAASNARGMLPRTPVQQAAATGVIMTAHYEIGAALWSVIASTAAGAPGSRAGNRALLTAAAITAGGGKVLEMQLRPYSRENIWLGGAWSQAKLMSVVGLAGGLVTASDIVIHDVAGKRRTPVSTLALDLTMGGLMAGGTWTRRRRRARSFSAKTLQPPVEQVDAGEPPVPGQQATEPSVQAPPKAKRRRGGRRRAAIRGAKTGAYVGATVFTTTVGLGVLAVVEQAGARLVNQGLERVVGEDLGEFGESVGHGVMFSAFFAGGLAGLNAVRKHLEGGASKKADPGYDDPPDSPFASAGPRSSVQFADIGREGRRFVTMRLSSVEIQSVMGEPAQEPIRIVIPRTGSIQDRAALAVSELIATDGIERSLICIAAPTGVGYVNYVMAEALEYLTRGDCAIVVPQYAYVPSLLALNKTEEATDLQEAVIAAVRSELATRSRSRSTRIVQFGESLGAQVAADVGGVRGSKGFDEAGLSAGLYLGIPFRSSLWRSYLRHPAAMTASGRIVVVPDSLHLATGDRLHVMVTHNDDPITKFAWTMVVQCPWWMGPASTRPPGVPRETYFRPVTSFVLAIVDGLNGMNTRPGAFQRSGHDYRADMRESLQKTFGLSVSAEQVQRIEDALRAREHEWAAFRVIAREGETAARNVVRKFNAWGRGSVNLELDELPGDAGYRLVVDYLNKRLGANILPDEADTDPLDSDLEVANDEAPESERSDPRPDEPTP